MSSRPQRDMYQAYLDSPPKFRRFRAIGVQAGYYRGSLPDDDTEPSLADQHKVGFFSLDRCSQTEITEVVDLKEMTEVIQILLQDVKNLRRDINFTKHVMQADYESKVQEKSTDLYCRINEKVDELEKMHEERVGVVRRAFRQQLADAIARVSVLYNKNLERKIRSEKQRQAGEQDKIDEKYKELQATIQRNDMVIQMLKNQLAQYQQQKIAEEDIIEELSIKSRSPSINPEMEELREEVDNLMRKIERMEEDLLQKDDETNTLTKEIENLSLKLQEEKATAEKYKSESDNLKSKIEQDMASSKRIMQNQKAEFQKMMEAKMQEAREEALKEAQKEALSLQNKEKDKLKLLMDQKKLLEEQLAKEKNRNNTKSQGEIDAEKYKRNEQKLKEEIQRLKQEIERVHRTWEKKFAILQQSLHALKDESYLRQTLQRQAAALHHAAVSYATDTPMGIMPSSKRSSPMKKPPLPEIPKSQKGPGTQPNQGDKDYISYTVSAPSGRGTAMLSVDGNTVDVKLLRDQAENQVLSDGEKEDIPTDVEPLPDPPKRPSQERHERRIKEKEKEESDSKPPSREKSLPVQQVQTVDV